MLGSQPYVPTQEKVQRVKLEDIASKEESVGTEVVFRAIVENARVQSAKLAFLVFRQGLSTIQAVVAASDTLSRSMVKFAGSIPAESVVLVHAVVQKPVEPVTSTTIQHIEVHVKKLYIVAKADAQLPLQIEDAERPIPGEGLEEQQKEDEGRPIVTLNTRLNNRVIDLRGKHNHAIFTIKDGVSLLFSEFLRSRGFLGFKTARIVCET